MTFRVGLLLILQSAIFEPLEVSDIVHRSRELGTLKSKLCACHSDENPQLLLNCCAVAAEREANAIGNLDNSVSEIQSAFSFQSLSALTFFSPFDRMTT